MNKNSRSEKLISHSKYGPVARLVVDTCLKMEDEGRLGIHKRLGTSLGRKSWKRLLPVVDNTIEEVLHSVVGDSYDNFKDKSLQQSLKVYLQQDGPTTLTV